MSKKFYINLSIIIIIGVIAGFILYFSIPSEIILPRDSQLSFNTFPSCSLTEDCILTESKPLVERNGSILTINTGNTGDFSYSLKLFDKIPLKKINVSVIPKNYVIPGGETVGVKLYTEGLLVVYVSEVTSTDGAQYSPGKDAGLRENDRILKVDGKDIGTNEEFTDYINAKKSTVHLTIARNEEITETDASPVISGADGKYKLGIWVRDSTAGIGTLTFYNPQNNGFAALGHAICDSDTLSVLKLAEGSLMNCSVISVKKGEYGNPGELKGCITGGDIGKILINDSFGIYGELNNTSIIDGKEPIEVSTRFQVKEGPAVILCDVDGGGTKEYAVEISKVSKSAAPDNKGMVITVTDEELLQKTGGIVQGMSGSPIIQNDMLVGAVTHVFVNDPHKGYGIFAENMLEKSNSTEAVERTASVLQFILFPPLLYLYFPTYRLSDRP